MVRLQNKFEKYSKARFEHVRMQKAKMLKKKELENERNQRHDSILKEKVHRTN